MILWRIIPVLYCQKKNGKMFKKKRLVGPPMSRSHLGRNRPEYSNKKNVVKKKVRSDRGTICGVLWYKKI
jgi:hypothetical protein